MIKKFLLTFFLLISATGLFAQTFGNEWINYSQKYYKIKISSDGVYRVDSTTLANAGIPLNTIHPKNFQIFAKGIEQYIYCSDAGSVFKNGDYLEFYAQHNDGTFDSLAYSNIPYLPNPYYSLFNDTATYFLTWNSSLTNKRMSVQTDTAFSLYTPSNYFFKESVYDNPVVYYSGQTYDLGTDAATDPHYTTSEGWFDNEIDLGTSGTQSLDLSYPFISGPAAAAKEVLFGESQSSAFTSADHHIQIQFHTNSGSTLMLEDTTFYGYAQNQYSFSILASNLGSNANFMLTSVSDPGFVSNRLAIGYVYVKYSHLPDMEGKSSFSFIVPNTLQAKSYLNFGDFSASSIPILYDLTNHSRIAVIQNGSNYQTLIINSGGEKKCFLTSDNQIQKINFLKPVNSNGNFTNFSTITADSAYIIVSHPSLYSAVSNYVSYRSFDPNGGHFNVVYADVNELYDQFAYGIDKDPLSIRNFCNYAINKWPGKPKYLFLIGKGIHSALFRQDTSSYNHTLVPSFGNPSSDILFTSGLNGTFLQPAIPTGRLAANVASDVTAYLNKVKQFETAPAALWKKQILHFGGGSSAGEQALYASYLNNYKNIIQGTFFGGYVHTFLKTTSAPIQITISDSVKSLINNGVSIMTFFGHASGGNFDQNLDVPSAYNNTGKYPMLIANSCFAGDIFQPLGQSYSSTSESFVLIPQKGTIGFLANVELGVSYALDDYSNQLYKNITYQNYGGSIGNDIQKTITAIQGTGIDPYISFTCSEMTLHGDPAIVVNSPALPDYAVSDSSLYFSPQNITTQIDSFQVHVVISNNGKAINTPVTVNVNRIFPDNSTQLYTRILPNIYYQDTLSITMPVNKIKGAGLNKFEVMVDPANLINEITKSNNSIGNGNINNPAVPTLITSGDIIPIYPYQFAIIPNDTATLKASTGNPFAPVRKYIFQIDTTDTYNSPFARAQVITSAGGVVNAYQKSWSFNLVSPTPNKSTKLLFQDSTVYYWRVKRDTSDTKDYPWQESSFQFITGKRGWEQAHYFQFKNDGYNYIKYNRPMRRFDFTPTGKTLECDNYGQIPPNYNLTQLYGVEYKLDLSLADYGGCGVTPGIMIAVIDPVSLIPWGTHYIDNTTSPATDNNPTHSFGNVNNLGACRARVEYYFEFQQSDPIQMKSLATMLADSVPNGYYILAYSWIQGKCQSFSDPSAYTALQNIGMANVHSIPDTYPFIFFTKKGSPTSSIEMVGDSANAALTLITNLTNNSSSGSITGPLIGPSARWDSLAWRQHAEESPTADSVRLNIIGINQNGIQTVLRNNISPSFSSLNLSFINPVTYPYLMLNTFMKDTMKHTPGQLNKWQVFYAPEPEVAINPNKYFSFHADTIQQGDSLKFKVAVQNISEFNMDSMLVTYWVVDNGNAIHPLASQMTRKLPAGDTLISSVKVPTTNYVGINSLWIEVNPLSHPQTRLEQYHFNNIAKIAFFVGTDHINPIMDVTFDGVHILNNDIVSAKPNILIGLKDENKFLALNDTSDFAVYIRNTNQATSQRVYFGPQMTFQKAVLPNNSCKINYMPSFSGDGTYELSVQATDRSSNSSGTNNYKIDFQVINKPMITNMLNYPNPFSTSTRFVFTLTGSEIPQNIEIQIMTITGKIVKEISASELGSLHIGRNITEYAWNGKDEFGDRLANGVYLYRVITQLNGSEMQNMQTDADKYFTKGFGKMYLIH
ncbi:MAG: C25 family cysteine peptidase [Bacteroidia bacterium]